MQKLKGKICLVLALLSCTLLKSQAFTVECDDLGKPFQPRIVYLDEENKHLGPELIGFSVDHSVQIAVRRIPFTGGVISRFAQDNARTGRIQYSYADLKDNGGHYLLRIVINGGGDVRGPYRSKSGQFTKDFQFIKYVDFSIHIINIATTKVEKVLNVYSESYPFLKEAKEKRKKFPNLDLHSYALNLSITKDAQRALETFFFNLHDIEVEKETDKKVEGVLTKFKGPNFKKIYKGNMDIVEVSMMKESANGKLRIFKKIGVAKIVGMNKERMIYYSIYTGKKALKKAIENGKKVYLVRNANLLL